MKNILKNNIYIYLYKIKIQTNAEYSVYYDQNLNITKKNSSYQLII
jgi:hypothetical protein